MKKVWRHFDRKNRLLNLDECGLDVFEKDLIDMLELSDATRKAIENANG